MGTKVYASARNLKVITPSDSALVTCNALYIGSGGNLVLSVSSSATPITFAAVPTGAIIPIDLSDGRVMSTGTTAASIVGLSW